MYRIPTNVYIHECVCIMYIQIFIFMYMYVHSTYNYVNESCTKCINMYIHVCTMFRQVCTILQYLVQGGRIPDVRTSTWICRRLFWLQSTAWKQRAMWCQTAALLTWRNLNRSLGLTGLGVPGQQMLLCPEWLWVQVGPSNNSQVPWPWPVMYMPTWVNSWAASSQHWRKAWACTITWIFWIHILDIPITAHGQHANLTITICTTPLIPDQPFVHLSD